VIDHNKLIQTITRPLAGFMKLINQDQKIKVGLVAFLALVGIYVISKSAESNRVIYKSNYRPDFDSGRILNDPKNSYLKGKEKLLTKATKKLVDSQKVLVSRIDSLEKKLLDSQEMAKETKKVSEVEKTNADVSIPENGVEPIKVYPTDAPLEQSVPVSNLGTASFTAKSQRSRTRGYKGPSVISFPVKQKRVEEGVVLPTGSYVKAKLMTGIDAPEGKNYPVLLALDFSYIGPNKHRVDLTGCFMIAKTSPSLATERINFQANRLSCVSKSGKFFEKTISGFVADDSDNTFAVKAEVNSKQGRVAKMAFMKSVVDGIGEIITRKSKSIGGKNPDAANVMVQNGAQGAASKVSDWYLKQATSLLPTLSVGSGQDVWVIMQESVTLPNDFFRKNERRKRDAKVFSYFSRAID
jgi:hypothetical protein